MMRIGSKAFVSHTEGRLLDTTENLLLQKLKNFYSVTYSFHGKRLPSGRRLEDDVALPNECYQPRPISQSALVRSYLFLSVLEHKYLLHGVKLHYPLVRIYHYHSAQSYRCPVYIIFALTVHHHRALKYGFENNAASSQISSYSHGDYAAHTQPRQLAEAAFRGRDTSRLRQ